MREKQVLGTRATDSIIKNGQKDTEESITYFELILWRQKED